MVVSDGADDIIEDVVSIIEDSIDDAVDMSDDIAELSIIDESIDDIELSIGIDEDMSIDDDASWAKAAEERIAATAVVAKSRRTIEGSLGVEEHTARAFNVDARVISIRQRGATGAVPPSLPIARK